MLQLSVPVCNARLSQIMAMIGSTAVLKLRSGGPPASCAAADTGTVLSTINLSNWMAAPSNATVSGNGMPWTDNAADNDGTAGHFRIYAVDGTTCGLQGTVTQSGGGGDMTVDNTNFKAGQNFSVLTLTITDNNL